MVYTSNSTLLVRRISEVVTGSLPVQVDLDDAAKEKRQQDWVLERLGEAARKAEAERERLTAEIQDAKQQLRDEQAAQAHLSTEFEVCISGGDLGGHPNLSGPIQNHFPLPFASGSGRSSRQPSSMGSGSIESS